MTGGRLKRLKKYLDSNFLLTYGDGLSNVDINKLVRFHNKKKKINNNCSKTSSKIWCNKNKK